MNRITEKYLQAVCDRINRAMGKSLQPYENGAWQAGCFHISHAYGGVSLHQMCETGSGIRDVFRCGHVPKRELAERMHSFLDGIEFAQQSHKQIAA